MQRSLFPKNPRLQTQSFPSYLVLGSQVLHSAPIKKNPVLQTHLSLLQTLLTPQALQAPSMMCSFLELQTQLNVVKLKVDPAGQDDGVMHWPALKILPPEQIHWP